MSDDDRKVRVSIISAAAKAEGLSEKKFLIKFINVYGSQKAIAAALGVSQSAVSQAFVRSGIRPVIKYEYELDGVA